MSWRAPLLISYPKKVHQLGFGGREQNVFSCWSWKKFMIGYQGAYRITQRTKEAIYEWNLQNRAPNAVLQSPCFFQDQEVGSRSIPPQPQSGNRCVRKAAASVTGCRTELHLLQFESVTWKSCVLTLTRWVTGTWAFCYSCHRKPKGCHHCACS